MVADEELKAVYNILRMHGNCIGNMQMCGPMMNIGKK